jgi:hypothetical protein
MVTLLLWYLITTGLVWALFGSDSKLADKLYIWAQDSKRDWLCKLVLCDRCAGFWVGTLLVYVCYFVPSLAWLVVFPSVDDTWITRIPVSICVGLVGAGVNTVLSRFQFR